MALRLIYDTETKNLLNSETIDYTASPYCIKDKRFMHCAGFKELGTDRRWQFVGEELYDGTLYRFLTQTEDEEMMVVELIGHNIINFDNMVLKLLLGIHFTIGLDGEPDTMNGRPIKITDTLVLSKTLNPDRPQHSIDYHGRVLGLEKIDWRAKAIEIGLIQPTDPKGAEFRTYHEEMAIYMMRDIDVNERVYNFLMREWGDWDWGPAYELEKYVADVITRQEHRGFAFDKQGAIESVKFLDSKMEELRALVEPLIPPKPLTKTDIAKYTPVSKQFKMNGDPTTHILNFAKKHGGEFVEVDGVWTAELYGKTYTLPMPDEPIFTHTPAKLDDTLHIKQWLVSIGWQPTQYKERDLTVDSKKKKLLPEKFADAVEKWVDQTLASPFKNDRLDEIEGVTRRVTKEALMHKLLRHEHMKRPLIVYTNPTLTVGMEREIDPKLLELSDKFAYAKEISHYLTYKHRRNSLLGGGIDPDDDEDEMHKGWMAVDRINVDGRIPTPADTCGAATSRFKHRLVANIPRTTSMYGTEMREKFGAGEGCFQMGYDFDSLEAKIESHYVFRYEGGPAYGISLTAEKPNDCHTVLAGQISVLLGRPFPRVTAKNVKYGCSYNAQVKRVAKTVGCSLEEAQIIFDTFWQQAFPLKQLKERMQAYWETTGGKKFLLGIDGRKLPIRSKGNVINTAFQSAGVICAKRAMAVHDKKLKAEGLAIDFFVDDWRQAIADGKHICQQMIAYHDEAQSEITKASVKFKMFKFDGPAEVLDEATKKMVQSPAAKEAEKAAKAFKREQTDKVWSDVGHTDKAYYVAYNRAGELATEAVREAGIHFKLNVELTAGYVIGRNWAECH